MTSRAEPPPGSGQGIIDRVREACREMLEREREELADMDDPNCYGAGYASGSIAAANEILACLDEEADR